MEQTLCTSHGVTIQSRTQLDNSSIQKRLRQLFLKTWNVQSVAVRTPGGIHCYRSQLSIRFALQMAGVIKQLSGATLIFRQGFHVCSRSELRGIQPPASALIWVISVPLKVFYWANSGRHLFSPFICKDLALGHIAEEPFFKDLILISLSFLYQNSLDG